RTVIALTLGFVAVPTVALAATDAVPGDPFKLGQENRIVNQSTTLSGVGQKNEGVLKVRKEGGTNAGAGAAFKVVNEGKGIARGIDITVAPGKPPIAVNADAGLASNLNADRLDGKSEEDFLPSRLYGVATGLVNGPGGGKTVLVSGVNFGCDEGDVALSAGGNAVDPEDALNGIVPFRSSYQIEFTDNGGASRFSANMICADVSKPFR
ncbi:MAG TPA: hypothetical protein VI300_14915, partial [Solirubrobacter sp.]